MDFEIATLKLNGGARLGICPLPGRFGLLKTDIATVVRWQPDAVLTMISNNEYRIGHAARLGQILKDQGVAWHHLPVKDFGVPRGAWVDTWPTLSTALRSILDKDGAVLAHCFGGRGRAGMILMRLMVEYGIAPDDALRRLRAVRPGAVETDAQQSWASDGSAE